MDLRELNKRKQNRDIALLLIPFVAIVAKIIYIFFLPGKYKYDGTRINSMITGDNKMRSWGAYNDVVDIYKKINIFHFTTIEQWSIALGIILTIMIMILISRVKYMSIMESLFTLMAVGVLNIYTFNLAKEPIQFFFFTCIFVVIILPIKSVVIKLLGCVAIFYWESFTFRSYYIMMAVMSLALFAIFYFLRKLNRIKAIHIALAIVLCYVMMFLFVYSSQYVSKKDYNDVMTRREEYANDEANTAIKNVWEINDNYGMFMANYVVCSIRMMLPVELLWKGIGYFPFVFYQIFILVYYIRALRNLKYLNKEVVLAVTCFTAYLFGSFVFEPDFGSWVRHESTTFPIFYLMAYEDFAAKEELSYEAETI